MELFSEIQELSRAFIHNKHEKYRRYLIQTTPMKHRFALILGERGIGKTTTIIQKLLDAVNQDQHSDKILYVQADHFIVQNTTLYEIAEYFYRLGGQIIAFDEIHKYLNWSQELKSIYDTFPDLYIIASGSSALEIHKGSHDLSRRAIVYKMVGLSLREFIELKYDFELPRFNLKEILNNHVKLTASILEILSQKNLKILKLFHEYLQEGYYPYFREFKLIEEFKITLEQNIHTTIESDLVAIYPQLTGNSIKKMKQLLVYIANSVPFMPNWQKIKNIVEIGDDRTLKTYFKYLEDAFLVHMLDANTDKFKQLELPPKIFLGNPSQIYTLAIEPNIGNVRETFFICMLTQAHEVFHTKNTDFCINKGIYVEVGGKKKDFSQIYDTKNAYLALDDIEYGSGKRIPLWLFGFLY